jgi:tetratricopeptide (TPR) repeat protein
VSAVGDRTIALARHYVEIDRPQAALDALAVASDDELTDVEYWLLRAEALRELERSEEAVEAARLGLELDPDEYALLDALGLAELDRDRVDAALEALTAAVELEPEHPVLLAHLALALARANRFVDARAALARAMRVAPDDAHVLRVRAQVAFLAEDAAAEPYVVQLLRKEPDDQTGHALRGALAARNHDYLPAAAAFAEAARIDPTERSVALAARESRIAAHPVLAPVRRVWKFGRWRSYFLYLGVAAFLAAARLETIRIVVAVIWGSVALLSWIGPPILRRREKRKYGEL